jgi:hypothetical protein
MGVSGRGNKVIYTRPFTFDFRCVLLNQIKGQGMGNILYRVTTDKRVKVPLRNPQPLILEQCKLEEEWDNAITAGLVVCSMHMRVTVTLMKDESHHKTICYLKLAHSNRKHRLGRAWC